MHRCMSAMLAHRAAFCVQWPKVRNAPLSEVDPELEDIIEHEKNRQWKVRVKASVCLLRTSRRGTSAILPCIVAGPDFEQELVSSKSRLLARLLRASMTT